MEFPDTLARRLTEALMADLHATLTHACPSDATGLYNRVYSRVYAYFDALTGEGTPYPPQVPPPPVPTSEEYVPLTPRARRLYDTIESKSQWRQFLDQRYGRGRRR